jgi:hypothetical protein
MVTHRYCYGYLSRTPVTVPVPFPAPLRYRYRPTDNRTVRSIRAFSCCHRVNMWLTCTLDLSSHDNHADTAVCIAPSLSTVNLPSSSSSPLHPMTQPDNVSCITLSSIPSDVTVTLAAPSAPHPSTAPHDGEGGGEGGRGLQCRVSSMPWRHSCDTSDSERMIDCVLSSSIGLAAMALHYRLPPQWDILCTSHQA